MGGEHRSSSRRRNAIDVVNGDWHVPLGSRHAREQPDALRSVLREEMENRFMRRMRMEDDGTLGRAVFSELRKPFADEDRARGLMGATSALGMVYFESIEAATGDLVQRDLRVCREDAVLVVASCDEAAAKLERPKQEHTVMVAQNEKAQAQITRMLNSIMGAKKTPAKKALAQQSTLREALVKQFPTQKPKPRNSGMVDEELWASSMGAIYERLIGLGESF